MRSFLSAVIFFFALISSAQAQSDADRILGEWMSPTKDGRILIYKTNNKYYGSITWGTGGSGTDDKNPDPALRKRPVIGLEILKDFVFDSGEWIEGTIYDPREGKTYSCKLTLDQMNNKLNIRGYLGISLFGRTETWTRVVNPGR